MILFNGNERAAERLRALAPQASGKNLKIAAVLFGEDAGSKLYTRLKKEAAESIGITYEVHEFSLTGGTTEVEETLAKLNADTSVTGIIIQKPYRSVWATTKGIDQSQGLKEVRQAYNSWWQFLTSRIDPEKDVDGLRQQSKLLPATARAVMMILDEAFQTLGITEEKQKELTMFVLGRSDIVGLPVFEEMKNRGYKALLLTRDDLVQRAKLGKHLTDGDVIVSATGQQNLVTGEMVKDGVIVVDVGEPKPDVELETVKEKAAFITPVPGGVGPMTVACLLENCVELSKAA